MESRHSWKKTKFGWSQVLFVPSWKSWQQWRYGGEFAYRVNPVYPHWVWLFHIPFSYSTFALPMVWCYMKAASVISICPHTPYASISSAHWVTGVRLSLRWDALRWYLGQAWHCFAPGCDGSYPTTFRITAAHVFCHFHLWNTAAFSSVMHGPRAGCAWRFHATPRQRHRLLRCFAAPPWPWPLLSSVRQLDAKAVVQRTCGASTVYRSFPNFKNMLLDTWYQIPLLRISRYIVTGNQHWHLLPWLGAKPPLRCVFQKTPRSCWLMQLAQRFWVRLYFSDMSPRLILHWKQRWYSQGLLIPVGESRATLTDTDTSFEDLQLPNPRSTQFRVLMSDRWRPKATHTHTCAHTLLAPWKFQTSGFAKCIGYGDMRRDDIISEKTYS